MSEQTEQTAKLEPTEHVLNTYTKKERNMYLTGLAGQNVIYNIINVAFANFAQFTIAIPAMVVSAILTVARIWDAFNDPMMGTIVDKTRSRWGKCRPYLIFVPLPIMLITISCFVSFGPYEGTQTWADLSNPHNLLVVLWAAFTYILWGMTYTVGDIPLWGVTALMTESAEDRNKLLSLARMIAGVGGGAALLTIIPVINAVSITMTERMGGDPNLGERMGYLVTASIYAFVGCALYQLTGPSIKERIPPSPRSYTLGKNFSLMWTNKPFRQVLLSGILGSPKMLIMNAAMPLIQYYFASKDATKAFLYLLLLGGGMFVGQFVAMGFVPRLTAKYEKKDLYNYSNLISVLPFLAIFASYQWAPDHNVTTAPFLAFSFVLFAICGGANGIGSVLQSIMIADAVDYEEYHNGVRTDGAFFSGQTFLAKLTSAIATILSGIAFSYVGFSDAKVLELNDFVAAGGIPRLEPKYQSYMMILFFIVSIPPAIGSILAVLPTWKYAQSDAMHDKILAELNERRHKLAVGDDTTVEETSEA